MGSEVGGAVNPRLSHAVATRLHRQTANALIFHKSQHSTDQGVGGSNPSGRANPFNRLGRHQVQSQISGRYERDKLHNSCRNRGVL